LVTNYYLVLGVPRDESAAGIRTAYRGLVKRHHPDRTGGTDAMRFREAAQAYRVLADEERRRRYDHALGAETGAAANVPFGGRSWPEPETLADPMMAPFGRRVAIPSAFRATRPSLEELLARLRRAATGIGRPKGGRLDEVHVELLVAPDEASHGGAVDVGVPVPQWCAACAGSGRGAYGACGACGGEGTVVREAVVRAWVPSLARDATFDFPLDALGLDDIALRLHVRIAPWRVF
jgi:molecular chaperone DnaJ